MPAAAAVYIIPALLATGAALWEWLRPERDPDWGDRDVFNDRMRQIQTSILDLNNAFGRCKAFVSNKQQISAWRNFRTNWTKWYKDTGKLTTFNPNDAQISNAKLYTSQLAKWIDVLKSYHDCLGTAVTPATGKAPSGSVTSSIDWFHVAGAAAAGWLLSRVFQRLR